MQSKAAEPPGPGFHPVRAARCRGADATAALRGAFARDFRRGARHRCENRGREVRAAQPQIRSERAALRRRARRTSFPEVKEALDAFREAGFMAAAQDFELGGMQLPWTVAQACFAWFNAANISTAGYAFLTIANANLIRTFGSEAQKATVICRRCCRAASSAPCACPSRRPVLRLSDIRTTAHPQADGSYRLTGNKMWISAGEHELSENIVHLVLARIHGAPAGVKGISLFIVPKIRVNEDGSLGRTQRRGAGRAESQDGISRHDQLRAQFRRARRCLGGTGRRAEQGACLHVPDDERGAHRRGHRAPPCSATPAICTRWPMRASGRRAGCPAARIPRAAAGQDHRACRRAAHAAGAKGLCRRGAGAVPVLRQIWWMNAAIPPG